MHKYIYCSIIKHLRSFCIPILPICPGNETNGEINMSWQRFVLVAKDMDVNEHEKLSNFIL